MLNVGVIGTGRTGASIAFALLHRVVPGSVGGIRLTLHDPQGCGSSVARGQAVEMDLADALSYGQEGGVCHVQAIEQMGACNVVVVAAKGSYDVNTLKGDKRKAGLQSDLPIIRGVGEALRGFTGAVLVVSNPSDTMARVLAEASGLPKERIFSFGASLDSARVRAVLHSHGYDTCDLSCDWVGEHGPSGFIRWSCAKYRGVPLALPDAVRSDVERRVRERGYEIVELLGSSCAGPAVGVSRAVQHICHGGDDLLGVPIEVVGPVGYVYAGLPVRLDGAGGWSASTPDNEEPTEHERVPMELNLWRASVEALERQAEAVLGPRGRGGGRR